MNSRKNTLLSAALSGFVFAGSAVAAQATTTSPAAAKVAPATEEASGECHGVNSCKGTGDCGSKSYSCAGNNSCKGKGWIKMTKKECTKKKGKFVAG